jgi:hypothetical protein
MTALNIAGCERASKGFDAVVPVVDWYNYLHGKSSFENSTAYAVIILVYFFVD